MNLQANDFELFGLPERQALDRAELDARWKSLQARVHPDRYAAEGAAAQRVAMQWAVRVNEAYHRLKDPLRRAAYLCELRGASIGAHDNTAMPQDFLMQQLAWRETLDEAADETALQALCEQVHTERARRLALLQTLLDERGNAQAAAEHVRALMFIERFAQEVERRLDGLGQ